MKPYSRTGKVKIEKRKVKKMFKTKNRAAMGSVNDYIIKMSSKSVFIKPKELPKSFECELCRNKMEFVSIDIGYSCVNEDCLLHVEEAIV